MTDTPGVGTVHATQDQLNTMANKCMETRESIATGMAQLLDRINGLSGAGMSGAANNALQGSSAQLNQGLTKMLNALDDLAGKISNASSTFGVNDEDAANDIRAAAAATGDSTVIAALRG
ncbi:WXG100 family type VII secretion target [Dactylosporangium fulvum]|uniref:WXG100 family type VII secretion target n=1 Tax=Dactylosporangium fulvum TaxID=53359 RepID=A0ABY5VUH5_9ACTN|nr:WXG100 family type VII secretion target [Dactylosporangium fulvum]UWP80474.1 WXG100 family type VII secretion target [Dactylosporangium fulvum]